ncbi:sugar transferase [Thioclava sp. BHET1]|nr:sugar transferase [Thioclava sp. BHET1]
MTVHNFRAFVDQTHYDDVSLPQRRDPGRKLYISYGKRGFDLAVAMILLPLLAPVIALLWLAARRDGGPGFFGHARIGRDGTPFRCWKIRTMAPDAEELLHRYLRDTPDAAAEWRRERKLSCDPRITRWGHFLRRTSLDELPQIWNVLRGEMSLVGPRPVVMAELVRYGTHCGAYLSMRPGVTGLWQISGRNSVSYRERVVFDVTYCQSCSLRRDLTILLRTVFCVLRRTGH